MTYIHRVGPLIDMQMTIEDDINPIIVQHLLHGLSHALILQIVSSICSRRAAYKLLYCRLQGDMCGCATL